MLYNCLKSNLDGDIVESISTSRRKSFKDYDVITRKKCMVSEDAVINIACRTSYPIPLPEVSDMFKSKMKVKDFLNYESVEKYEGDIDSYREEFKLLWLEQ